MPTLSNEDSAELPLTWIDSLRGQYPNPNRWDRDIPINKRDVFRFAQQWLTEGIPYCFQYEPMTFERARERMADVLEESPKHVSLTGSARLGFSLGSKFGNSYNGQSDFDMFVVSSKLFGSLASDGQVFAERVRSGLAEPNNKIEEGYWKDTADRMDELVNEKHFIDHWLIPRRKRYPTVDQIYRSIIAFERSLTVNASSPRKWNTTVRVYRDWDAALRKIGGSLLSSLTSQGFTIES